MRKKSLISFGIVGILIVVAAIFFLLGNVTGYTNLKSFDEKIVLYKSSSCGCCGTYAKYFQDKGNENIEIITLEDVGPIKDNYNVPTELRSCHTISLGEYYVEGHVPLEAVEKLLQEKPDIAGLAMGGMRGMPSGSPGMPGTKTEDFIIYGINHDGSSFEFMRM